MNRVQHFALLPFAALAMFSLASCRNGISEHSTPPDGVGCKVSFSVGCLPTRAAFGSIDQGVYPTLWSGDESVAIWLNWDEKVVAAVESVSADGLEASWSAEFTDKSTSQYRFGAFLPAQIVGAADAANNRIKIEEVAVLQTPTTLSCDPRAMILYSCSESYNTLPAKIALPQMEHATAYGCLTLQDIPAADNVERVVITANVPLAGAAWLYYAASGDIAAGTIADYRSTEPSKRVIVNTSSKSDIWFACRPTTSLSQLTIEVYTDRALYAKTVVVEGRNFSAGRVARLTVGGFSEVSLATTIHTVDEFNHRPSAAINTHADEWRRSVLEYDLRSYRLLNHSDLSATICAYPRIHRLSDGKYMLTYQQNYQAYNVYYAIGDDLNSLSYRGALFDQKNATGSYKKIDIKVKNADSGLLKAATCIPRYTSCDFLTTYDGTLLAFATRWPKDGYNDYSENTAIVLRCSLDNGLTWSDEQVVWQGWNWEPYALQCSSGELQLYFTRSNPIKADSGTALLRSIDGGVTWTDEGFVARQKSLYPAVDGSGDAVYTDQMPVAIELNNGKGTALVMESRIGKSGVDPECTYYISTALSTDDWDSPFVVDYNVSTASHRSNIFLGAAPYLVQFPSGETVMSYNNANVCTIVQAGPTADFGSPSKTQTPFPYNGCWGSMSLADPHTLVVANPYAWSQGTDKYADIMIGRMILNHRIDAAPFTPVVDGSCNDWSVMDDALFLGSATNTQSVFRLCFDAENIYLAIERSDDEITADDLTKVMLQSGDGSDLPLVLLFTPDNTNGKVVCDNPSVECRSVVVTGQGYSVEIGIPRAELGIVDKRLLFNATICEGSQTDGFDGLNDDNYSLWIPIVFDSEADYTADKSRFTIGSATQNNWGAL